MSRPDEDRAATDARADAGELAPALAQARDACLAARSVLVLGHVRPDGDTSSSALALGRALRALGKSVTVSLVDGMPGRTAFLARPGEVTRDPAEGAPYDLAVTVDVASYVRLGFPLRESGVAARIVNIDHHATNERFGDVDWVDDGYAATAHMILDLVEALAVPLGPELATPIFAGLATDTGYFRFEATTPETLRAAARLVEAGADHVDLHRRLFEETSLGYQRVVGLALGRAETRMGGAILWTWLGEAEAREAGFEGAPASVGVGPLCRVAGVELAACLEHREDGTTVVEFRSRGEVRVDQLAARLGGGGHAKASGCTLEGSPEQVRLQVLGELEALLDARAGVAA